MTVRGNVAFRFKPGDRVRVDTRIPTGHCRTPFYLRGKVGTVVLVHGAFRNPEDLAYYRPGLPELPLYMVRFPQAHVWLDYVGPSGDTVAADLYEHWLTPVAAGVRDAR
ncbi:MAG: nitrile hydratase subunit beta [Alphaproteobacteria bacterium]|nr:nitrile hydratase subunit beta [Alphaproteobacteria bacterium]